MGRVSEIGAPHHLGWDGKRHYIWPGGWTRQVTEPHVFVAIVGDEVMVRTVHFHGNSLMRWIFQQKISAEQKFS